MAWFSTLLHRARGTLAFLAAVAFLATVALIAGAAFVVRGREIRADVPLAARLYLVTHAAMAEVAREQLGRVDGARVSVERRLTELLPGAEMEGAHPDRLRVFEIDVAWPLAEAELAARIDEIRRVDGMVDLIDLNARERREATVERAGRHVALGIGLLGLGAAIFLAAVVGAAMATARDHREEIGVRFLLGMDAAQLWRPLASLIAAAALLGSLLACAVALIAVRLLSSAVPSAAPIAMAGVDPLAVLAMAVAASGTTGLAWIISRRVVSRAARSGALLALLATLAPCVSARAFEPFEAITREVDALHGVGRELAVCRRALHLAKGGLGATQRQALRALAMRDRVLVRLVEAQRAQDARDVLSWQAICDRLATERGRLRQALRVSRELGPPIQPRIRPVAGPVRVRFGQAGRSPGTAEFRNGVALGVRPGDTVRATARGKVAFAGVLARSGPVVVIDHGARTYSVYAKIAEALVVRGMEVDPGEPVGRAGFEPLYFSIRRRGHALDPLAWLGRS